MAVVLLEVPVGALDALVVAVSFSGRAGEPGDSDLLEAGGDVESPAAFTPSCATMPVTPNASTQ